MVNEMINGTFRQTNLPNESEEYLFRREQVRLAEIDTAGSGRILRQARLSASGIAPMVLVGARLIQYSPI